MTWGELRRVAPWGTTTSPVWLLGDAVMALGSMANGKVGLAVEVRYWCRQGDGGWTRCAPGAAREVEAKARTYRQADAPGARPLIEEATP